MGPNVVQKGGAIVEILVSYAGTPTTQSKLDDWINNFGLPVTSVMDPPSMPLASLGALGALDRREIAYLVDLSTMKVLQKFVGSTDGSGTSSAAEGMQAMLVLLGGHPG